MRTPCRADQIDVAAIPTLHFVHQRPQRVGGVYGVADPIQRLERSVVTFIDRATRRAVSAQPVQGNGVALLSPVELVRSIQVCERLVELIAIEIHARETRMHARGIGVGSRRSEQQRLVALPVDHARDGDRCMHQWNDRHDGDEALLQARSLNQASGHYTQRQEQAGARQVIAMLEIQLQREDRGLQQMRGEKEQCPEHDRGPRAAAYNPSHNQHCDPCGYGDDGGRRIQ